MRKPGHLCQLGRSYALLLAVFSDIFPNCIINQTILLHVSYHRTNYNRWPLYCMLAIHSQIYVEISKNRDRICEVITHIISIEMERVDLCLKVKNQQKKLCLY